MSGLVQHSRREIVQDIVQTPADMHIEPKRLTSLDALRGVAALSIVVWHWQHFFAIRGSWQSGWTAQMQPLYWLLKPLYVQGWAAVDLFFVLSGLRVLLALSRCDPQRRDGRLALRSLLRFSRLYPLHARDAHHGRAAAVLLLPRVTGSFSSIKTMTRRTSAAQLFMVQNWWPGSPQSFDGPSWSVSIEILLYFMFFAVCRAGLQRGVHCFLLAHDGLSAADS